MQIGVIDYGLGNIRSVIGAIEYLGYSADRVAEPEKFDEFGKLILPGVGAFGRGMELLRARNLVSAIQTAVISDNRPILGICLGMQLLAETSHEFGFHYGLGVIAGEVVGLSPDDPELRVPHVGWTAVSQINESVLFDGIPDEAEFYHVHSYHLLPIDAQVPIATCTYGSTLVSAIQKGVVFGTQFHPEKSQKYGLMVLRNFLEKA